MTTYEPKTACGPPEALPKFQPPPTSSDNLQTSNSLRAAGGPAQIFSNPQSHMNKLRTRTACGPPEALPKFSSPSFSMDKLQDKVNQPSTNDTKELLQTQITIMHKAKRNIFRILGKNINNTKLQQTLANLPQKHLRHTWLENTIKKTRAHYEEYTIATENLLDLIDDPVLLKTQSQQCNTARKTLLRKIVNAENFLW